MVISNEQFQPLTDTDKSILDFEKQNYKYAGMKESVAKEKFNLTPPQYYQHLNNLIDHPEAETYAPMVVSRLRGIREKGMKNRTGGMRNG